MDKEVQKMRKALKRRPSLTPTASDFLSTGSTLLNLACSDRVQGGLAKGGYYLFVGDSSSGKTFITLTCFAEATANSHFANYRLIFDNAEGGALMDMRKFFGSQVAEKIEPPDGTIDDPVHSTNAEEFYDNVDRAKNAGKPFIYVLDSMDALTSEGEESHSDKRRKDREKGRESSGSYGTDKAKVNSAELRKIITKVLRPTGSILIIISQTRDNIGFGAKFQPKTRAGGNALTFFASLELWTSQREKMKKRVLGKDRELGIIAKIRVKKNRVTGKDRTVLVPILHSVGIDDLGSCVDYLIEEGHWKERGGEIRAHDFEFQGTREGLIENIESEGKEKELRRLVGEVWADIEKQCEVPRKRRYD